MRVGMSYVPGVQGVRPGVLEAYAYEDGTDTAVDDMDIAMVMHWARSSGFDPDRRVVITGAGKLVSFSRWVARVAAHVALVARWCM